MNFLNGEVAGEGTHVVWPGQDSPVPFGRRLEPGRAVEIGMRPEHLKPDGNGPIATRVTAVEATGSQAYVLVDADGAQLAFLEQGRTRLRRDDPVALNIEPSLVHLFDPETGVSL